MRKSHSAKTRTQSQGFHSYGESKDNWPRQLEKNRH